MFQLIKGAHIADISGLEEGYQLCDNGKLTANVSAEKIIKVFESFISKMDEDEALFLYIEAPCSEDEEKELNSNDISKLHRNVYYLDGINRESALDLLHSGVGELLINDGLALFGIGSLITNIEIGKCKYNMLIGFLQEADEKCFTDIFKENDIPRLATIKTAWDLISEKNPGECSSYEFGGKDIYVLIEQLQELGLYKAETREE